MNQPTARRAALTEYAGVVLFFALVAVLSARLFELASNGAWGLVLAFSLAGYVVSDFTSGLVHWAFDTWGSERTPFFGKSFIVPFRIHHVDPVDITRHGFVATNGHNCLATAPVLFGALFLPSQGTLGPALLSFLFALCLGTFGTNQFHKWAHEPEAGRLVRTLQRLHLILGPEHHELHHTHPYDRHYCITTGWLNGVLGATGFFRRMESLITRLTGAVPRRDDLSPASIK